MSAINSTFLLVSMATRLLPLVTLEDLGRRRATQTPSCVASCDVSLPGCCQQRGSALSTRSRQRDAVSGIDRGGVFAAASAETLATDFDGGCADCGIAGALPPRR